MSTADLPQLDYTEIDQGLHLWAEILPMIEKQIGTLTAVAQEMQECPDREKYVDALMKIALRVNDVEEKATKCIKEARTQMKKTKLIDKQNPTVQRVGEDSDESDGENGHMEIDEQMEVPALGTEILEKLQHLLQKILIKPTESNAVNLESDNRYADFAECISKMQNENGEDEEANVVNQIVSDKCPLTQKPFVEAVQNRKCKHKYEKQMVLKYIADKNKVKRPAKCPSAGCEQILQEKDLIRA